MEVESLKNTLPKVVTSVRVEGYEHLDLMWADTARKTVFPKVIFGTHGERVGLKELHTWGCTEGVLRSNMKRSLCQVGDPINGGFSRSGLYGALETHQDGGGRATSRWRGSPSRFP